MGDNLGLNGLSTPEEQGKDPAAAAMGRKRGETCAAKMTKAERRKAAQRSQKRAV
jgi:hypothetical protein